MTNAYFHHRRWVVVGMLVTLVHCSEGDQSNSESHWLQACRTTEDCQTGLECLCGICTASCDPTQADCAANGQTGQCIARTSDDLTVRCLAEPSGLLGLCLAPCIDGQCDGNRSCEGGTCLPAEPVSAQPAELAAIAPNAIHVGETIEILGRHITTDARYQNQVIVSGYFLEQNSMAICDYDALERAEKDGQLGVLSAHRVDVTMMPSFASDSKIGVHIYPNVIFHPDGDQIGTLCGRFRMLTTDTETGQEYESNELEATIEILPSLIVRRAHPPTGGCHPVVQSTIGDQGFLFSVEAIGVADASPADPIAFTWSIPQHTWVLNTSSSFGTGGVPAHVVLKADPRAIDGRYDLRATISSGRIHQPDRDISQELSIVDDPAYPVSTGLLSNTFSVGQVKFETRVPRDSTDDYLFNTYVSDVLVAAATSSAGVLRIRIPLNVINSYRLRRTADKDQYLNWFPTVVVSSCQERPSPFEYDERDAQTEIRTFNGEILGSSGVPHPEFPRAPRNSAAFGYDTRSEFRSSDEPPFQAGSPPDDAASWVSFRRPVEIARYLRAIRTNACGQAVEAEELYINEVRWLREIAASTEACSEGLPTSSFTEADGPCTQRCELRPEHQNYGVTGSSP